MSATLRSDRVLLYAPTAGDGGAYALVDSTAADGAWWMAYAVTGAADQPIAGRQVALRRAVFTVSDRVPVTDEAVLRPLRDGILYRVTGTQPVPRAGEVLVAALSTGGVAVTITADVPRYTVGAIALVPDTVAANVGDRITFTPSVTALSGDVLPDRTPTWRSSDPTVCLVTASTGAGQCLSAGTALVTATVDGVTGTATVIVS